MCGPALPIVMGGLTALQIYGEYQGAKAQVKAQEQMAANAYRNANNQMSALESQKNRAALQAVEKMTQDQLRAAQAASAARVSAGEAGIAGVGVNRIVGDIGQQLGQEGAVTQRNLLNQQSNISSQQENVQLGLESQIKQFQTPVKGPDALSSILRIGTSVMGGMNMASSMGLNSGLAVNTANEVVNQNVGVMDFFKGALGLSPELTPITQTAVDGINAVGGQITQAGANLNFQKQVTGMMNEQFRIKSGG